MSSIRVRSDYQAVGEGDDSVLQTMTATTITLPLIAALGRMLEMRIGGDVIWRLWSDVTAHPRRTLTSAGSCMH